MTLSSPEIKDWIAFAQSTGAVVNEVVRMAAAATAPA